jgi:hypothetical protein
LYDFLQFTNWPSVEDPAAAAILNLCVYARGPVAEALTGLEGRFTGRQRIHVRVWPETAQDCQVLYFPPSADAQSYLATLGPLPSSSLAIAEGPAALDPRVAVQLYEVGDKLAFSINLTAARRSGLAFSSKLLRLAKPVR